MWLLASMLVTASLEGYYSRFFLDYWFSALDDCLLSYSEITSSPHTTSFTKTAPEIHNGGASIMFHIEKSFACLRLASPCELSQFSFSSFSVFKKIKRDPLFLYLLIHGVHDHFGPFPFCSENYY